MFKKLFLLIAAITSLSARGWSKDEITMLVMPRETTPIQIGQDISRRYPVLLVSYQMVHGDLKLHAWNGDSWVFVPVEDYTNGTFFANRPKTAVIVEDEKMHAPDVLTPSSLWCESAYLLTSTDPRVMLHLLGLNFDFPFRHWNQLAKRYGYALEEINPTLENVYWFHLQANVLMEKRAQRDFTIDLANWQPLATIPAPAIEPAVMMDAPVLEAPAVEPAATAVDIKVKAADAIETPEPAAETPPVAKPADAIPEPAPIAEAAPEVPEIKPVIETPAIEPPAVEIPKVEVPVETATETTPVVEIPAPVEAPNLSVDPFSAEEVPAAEIIVPPEPKKPWWKIF